MKFLINSFVAGEVFKEISGFRLNNLSRLE